MRLYKIVLLSCWMFVNGGNSQLILAQAGEVSAQHTSTLAHLAYEGGNYGQAATHFETILEQEEQLNAYFYGVLVSRALQGDAKAQEFFMFEKLTPAFSEYVAPLRAYFQLKSSQLSTEAAREVFEQLLQSNSPCALWPRVYLSLFCFELHTRTDVGAAQAVADFEALRRGLLRLQLTFSPQLASIFNYLELLYAHHLRGIYAQHSGGHTLPSHVQKHDLRTLVRFQEAHSSFMRLETLLQLSVPTNTTTNPQAWVILAAFADPNTQNMQAFSAVLQQAEVTRSWPSTLTQAWEVWPHGQVLEKHYPNLNWVGKWTIVDVWGTWCGPCKRQLPALQALFDRQLQHLNMALQVVTLSFQSHDLTYFMQQNAYTFPVEELEKHESAALDVKAYPTTWLIAPNGKYVQLSSLEQQLPWLDWLVRQ